MKIIIAGSHAQYLDYLRENNLTKQEAIYADSEERLLGLSFKREDIVKTGEWWKSQITAEFLNSRMLP